MFFDFYTINGKLLNNELADKLLPRNSASNMDQSVFFVSEVVKPPMIANSATNGKMGNTKHETGF